MNGVILKSVTAGDKPKAKLSISVTTTPAEPRADWSAVWAVFQKDWRGEWRTRASLNAIALFSLCAPVALSFSVANQKLEAPVLGGLLWSVLLFAALVGLPRSFVKEEESGTSSLLRLSCAPEAVLWGKSLFNLALLGATQLAAVPLFALLLDARADKPGLLVLVLLLGDLGLAVSSALLGAIAAQARARGALFPAIATPILLPLLVVAANATSVAFGARGTPWPAVQFLAAYDVIVVAAAWMLFEFVWS